MIYKNLENVIRKTKNEAEWLEKIQKIKDINYLDNEGFTPLGVSAYYESLEACKYIIDHSGDINLKNKYGETPLYIAIENLASQGHKFQCAESIIYLLLDKEVDVNVYNNDKKTILMHASQRLKTLWIEHKKIIKKLLNKGANIYAKDMFGITVLMYAANAGNYDIVKILVDKGVDIHEKDEDGKNALYYAVEYSWDSGYANDLEKQKESKEKIIELLLNKNADINTGDKSTGNTLLHIASYYGNSKLVQLCISNKININAQNNDGRTGLINAAENGSADIVDKLLLAGADPSIKDKDKKIAIWYAWKYKKVNVEEIFIN